MCRHTLNQLLSLLFVATLVAAQPLLAAAPKTNPMIHDREMQLIDGNGKPIKLRGVLLEGWLMWNGPLWGTGLKSRNPYS